MHVLITGGCGFIGSHLAEYHLSKNDSVTIIDNLISGNINNITTFKDHKAFNFIECDLLTYNELPKTVAAADRIYHMAAIVGIFKVLEEPIKVIQTNVIATEHLLNIAAESKRLSRIVIASSSSVYGNTTSQHLVETCDLTLRYTHNALYTYVTSKITNEVFSLAYFKQKKLPVTIVRLFNIIGSRQTGLYGMVVPRFVKQACNNLPLTIFGDGKQTRSFCDVRDATIALDLLANTNKSIGEIINVGNNKEISINDLAKLITKMANSKSNFKYIDYIDAYGENFCDIKQRRPVLDKLYSLISFKHQWPLERTIDDLIRNHINQ